MFFSSLQAATTASSSPFADTWGMARPGSDLAGRRDVPLLEVTEQPATLAAKVQFPVASAARRNTEPKGIHLIL